MASGTAGLLRKSKNKPGSCPANRLDTIQLTGWQTSKQTVPVVKSTADQRACSTISEGATDET